ncbi:MAG: alginate export family protein [Candidatus Acidiferrales bacterium]
MRRLPVCVLFVLLAVTAAGAQELDTQPIQIGGVTFSGSVRERYEAWDWFEPASGNNLYGYSGTVIRFGFSQVRTNYDWNVEFEAPVLLGLPNHAANPAPLGQYGLGGSYYAANHDEQNTAFIFPKQVFLRLKWEHASLRLGRFEFTDGSEVAPKDPTLSSLKTDRIGQRLIGNFGFSDVMRSLDGVQFLYANGPWNFTEVSAIPTRGVFQVDGWGWVKTPVTYVALTRQVAFGKSHAEWRAFGIYYNDDRSVVKTDNRPAAVRATDLGGINIGTYGGHFILAAPTNSAGEFDLLGWGVLQSGEWGQLKQRSGAFAAEGGWQPAFARAMRPWIRGGYYYSSGDGNAADETHGTFFAILPTPRVYARFPFFNSMNNTDLFAEVMLRPTKKLAIRSDVHGLWLSNKNDLWYTGGGAFQPWTFGFSGRPSNGGTSLATLYDISGDYKWKHGVSVGLYFGYAVGGDVIKKIYPVNANGALGYTELNYRF